MSSAEERTDRDGEDIAWSDELCVLTLLIDDDRVDTAVELSSALTSLLLFVLS